MHLEADGKDKAGAVITYVIDGKIENLALPQPHDHRHVEEPARERRVQDQQAVGTSERSSSLAPRACSLLLSPDVLRWLTVPLHRAPLRSWRSSTTSKPTTLSGVVTLVDWRNPHVHVFMNVQDAKDEVLNWAVELESPIDLHAERLEPRDAAARRRDHGARASRRATAAVRCGGNSVVVTATGRQVFDVVPTAPPPLLQTRPTPRWPDKQPRLGRRFAGSAQGYWALPELDRARRERRQRCRWTSTGC